MRLLTRHDTDFQPRLIAGIEDMLREEADAGRLDLPADLHEVAYVIVRLIESYTYLDLITGEGRRPPGRAGAADAAALARDLDSIAWRCAGATIRPTRWGASAGPRSCDASTARPGWRPGRSPARRATRPSPPGPRRSHRPSRSPARTAATLPRCATSSSLAQPDASCAGRRARARALPPRDAQNEVWPGHSRVWTARAHRRGRARRPADPGLRRLGRPLRGAGDVGRPPGSRRRRSAPPSTTPRASAAPGSRSLARTAPGSGWRSTCG